MPKNFKLTSASFKKKAPPTGKQNRTGTLGRVIKDVYKDVDSGFTTLEATVAAGDGEGFVGRVHSGTITIATTGNTGTAAVADATNGSPVFIHNNANAADTTAKRFTGVVLNDVLTITSRDAAGDAVNPTVELSLMFYVDGR